MNETIKTYDEIAESWSNFRQREFFPAWLSALATRWKGKSIVDIGCGNARNAAPFKTAILGIDASKGMIKAALSLSKKKNINAEFIAGDALSLPLKSESADCALAIALYHHMKPEDACSALSELFRVLKSGGEAFITVWSRMQPKFILKSPVQKIPWKRKRTGEVFFREYYMYTPWKLKSLLKRQGFEIVMQGAENSLKPKIFSRNICFLIRKP